MEHIKHWGLHYMPSLKKHGIAVLIIFSLVSCGGSPEKKFASHMQKEKEYLNSSQYKEAAIEFKNAVQIDPKNADSHYNLARAYLKTGPSGFQAAYSAPR